jgi:hypothetical protein
LQPAFEPGAGITVIEAATLGRRCIAAAAPEIVEAARGAAKHLPRDEGLWARAIGRAIDEGPRERPPAPAAPGLLAQIATLLPDRPRRQ